MANRAFRTAIVSEQGTPRRSQALPWLAGAVVKERNMAPAPYPDFRWLFRSLRTLPIIAIAALVGGIIGGFSVFAIDLAVTAPPSHDAGSAAGKITAEKAANPAATAPAAGTSAPPVPEHAAAQIKPAGGTAASEPDLKQPGQPAQAQDAPQPRAQTAPSIAVTPPLTAQQATWPDALSRRHNPPATAAAPSATAASAAAPAVSQQADSQPVAPQRAAAAPGKAPPAQAAPAGNASAAQPVKSQLARKPIPPKRYITVKRNAERAANDDADAAPRVDFGQRAKTEFARKPVAPQRQPTGTRNTRRTAGDSAEASARYGRRVYDSYGRADEARAPDARARYEYSNKPDYSRRDYSRRERADDDDRSADGYVEDSDRGDTMPPRPAAPPLFFGLFGFGDR
jgi:hypothetical protein